jgi:translocation and assembly module TamA
VGGDVTDNRAALYFGHRRSFRQTDDLLFPREGYLGTIEIGGAPPGLASREFFRVTGNASLLLAIGRSGDLLLRGQAGVVAAKTREGIPTTFLFRTGGDQTVRGYEFESLGVRQGDAIVGGRRLAVGSVEYTHWIGDNWGLAVFTDAGNAWDEGTTFEPALGYGVGARFRTPIGPIRADLAYGQKTSQFRIHFSVGYTF